MAKTSNANNTCLIQILPACFIPLNALNEENCKSACDFFSRKIYHNIIGISNTNNKKYFGFANSNPNILSKLLTCLPETDTRIPVRTSVHHLIIFFLFFYFSFCPGFLFLFFPAGFFFRLLLLLRLLSLNPLMSDIYKIICQIQITGIFIL